MASSQRIKKRVQLNSLTSLFQKSLWFLPPTYVLRREVMISQASVCSGGGGGGIPSPSHISTGPTSFLGVPYLHPIILPLVPGPFPGGYPSPRQGYCSPRWGVPQSQTGGTPAPDGGTPSLWMGYPQPGMGYPLSRSGWGTSQ